MNNTDPINANRQESYRVEYKELGSNYRLYSSWTFIVAGFSLTIQSAFFTLYGQALQRPEPPVPGIIIAMVGFTVFLASVIIKQRTIQLFSTMMKRGKELEFNLGLIDGQYSRLSELRIPTKGFRKFITHTWGIRLIYGMIGILRVLLVAYNYVPMIHNYFR